MHFGRDANYSPSYTSIYLNRINWSPNYFRLDLTLDDSSFRNGLSWRERHGLGE